MPYASIHSKASKYIVRQLLLFTSYSLPHRDPHRESSWLLKPFQKSDPTTGKPGEHETFLLHIQAGASALRRQEAVLVFSGAKTEPDAPLSESASYRDVLLQSFSEFTSSTSAVVEGRILCEDAATDSYQNLLFSLIKYYEIKGTWPQVITVITHSFKETRFLVRSNGPKQKAVVADSIRNATPKQFAGLVTEFVYKASIHLFH